MGRTFGDLISLCALVFAVLASSSGLAGASLEDAELGSVRVVFQVSLSFSLSMFFLNAATIYPTHQSYHPVYDGIIILIVVSRRIHLSVFHR